MRRAHEDAVKRIWEGQVRDELPATREEAVILAAQDRRADAFLETPLLDYRSASSRSHFVRPELSNGERPISLVLRPRQAQRFIDRAVADEKKIRARTPRLMRNPGPVGHREDIVRCPLERRVADARAAVAGDDEHDRIPCRARRPRCGTLREPCGIAVERRHYRPAGEWIHIAQDLCAIRSWLDRLEQLPCLRAGIAILGRVGIARGSLELLRFPELLILPVARLEEARFEVGDERNIRGVEPICAVVRLIDVAMPAHRRREDEIALLHLAAPAVDDG